MVDSGMKKTSPSRRIKFVPHSSPDLQQQQSRNPSAAPGSTATVTAPTLIRGRQVVTTMQPGPRPEAETPASNPLATAMRKLFKRAAPLAASGPADLTSRLEGLVVEPSIVSPVVDLFSPTHPEAPPLPPRACLSMNSNPFSPTHPEYMSSPRQVLRDRRRVTDKACSHGTGR